MSLNFNWHKICDNKPSLQKTQKRKIWQKKWPEKVIQRPMIKPITKFPTASTTQETNPARERGQQPPHPMGTETNDREGMCVSDQHPFTLSTLTSFVKFARLFVKISQIGAYSTYQKAIKYHYCMIAVLGKTQGHL